MGHGEAGSCRKAVPSWLRAEKSGAHRRDSTLALGLATTYRLIVPERESCWQISALSLSALRDFQMPDISPSRLVSVPTSPLPSSLDLEQNPSSCPASWEAQAGWGHRKAAEPVAAPLTHKVRGILGQHDAGLQTGTGQARGLLASAWEGGRDERGDRWLPV